MKRCRDIEDKIEQKLMWDYFFTILYGTNYNVDSSPDYCNQRIISSDCLEPENDSKHI